MLVERITTLVLDVDGVLTAGDVTFDARGERVMSFCIRDGMAIKVWQAAGHGVAILSGRETPIVRQRANELGIGHVVQGASDKGAALGALLERVRATREQTCYIGDDLPDVRPVRRCALGVAVAGAAAELKRHADYVTQRHGGEGAVAEVIEFILRKQQRWADALSRLNT